MYYLRYFEASSPSCLSKSVNEWLVSYHDNPSFQVVSMDFKDFESSSYPEVEKDKFYVHVLYKQFN